MHGTFGFAGSGRYTSDSGLTSSMAAQDAARATNKAKNVERDVRVLEASLAKTMMICEALWELLSQQHGLKIDALHKKLYEIDMRDGTLDGKNQRKAAECPSCGHTVSARHPACIYCGEVIDNSVFTLR